MSEKGEVKRDGARAQKNSGRGQYQKADAKWRGYVVDYKEYPKGIRITKEIWAKICTDTFVSDPNSAPALKIILGEGNQKVRLAIIEWDNLVELLDFYDENVI